MNRVRHTRPRVAITREERKAQPGAGRELIAGGRAQVEDGKQKVADDERRVRTGRQRVTDSERSYRKVSGGNSLPGS